ncbi:MFS transporter [Corynebacterium deserti]|nr:MFS transporter [Corynebacterium deserti]
MILSIVLLGYFMILLDTSIVITGLPAIGVDLGLSPLHLSWVQNAYTLSFGALLLLGARAGDIYGRKKTLNVGIVLFMVASVAIAFAPHAYVLIGARIVQGLDAAIIAPATLALITEHFPEGPQRLRATSAYGAVAGIGVAAGMVIGGVFAEALSWRIGFIINVPMGLILLYLVKRSLPATAAKQETLDILGAISSTLGIAGVLYAIVLSAENGWGSPTVFVPLAAGVVLFAWFLFHESRVTHPLLPLHLFKDRQRNAILASRFLLVGSVMSFFFFSTQLLQDATGFNALQAGLAFVPLSLVQFATARFSPRLAGHGMSEATLIVGGLLIMVVGMVSLAIAPYMVGFWIGLILVGGGQGFAFGPMTSSALSRATPEDAGALSGLVNSVHQIGGTFGVGVFGALAVAVVGHEETAAMITERAHLGFTISSVSFAVATILAVSSFAPIKRSSEQLHPS